MRNEWHSSTARGFRSRMLAATVGALLLMVVQVRESVAAKSLHYSGHFISPPDSIHVDTTSVPAIRVSMEALYALLAIGGGVNVDYCFLRTGSSAGITAGIRGFFSVQSMATIGAHSVGSETTAMIGGNLQLGAYVGNFEVNLGAGIGSVGNTEVAGPVTDLSAELLFRFGKGPLTLTLLGRLFVKDWDRSYIYTDNAAGYGGLGLRYQFGPR